MLEPGEPAFSSQLLPRHRGWKTPLLPPLSLSLSLSSCVNESCPTLLLSLPLSRSPCLLSLQFTFTILSALTGILSDLCVCLWCFQSIAPAVELKDTSMRGQSVCYLAKCVYSRCRITPLLHASALTGCGCVYSVYVCVCVCTLETHRHTTYTLTTQPIPIEGEEVQSRLKVKVGISSVRVIMMEKNVFVFVLLKYVNTHHNFLPPGGQLRRGQEGWICVIIMCVSVCDDEEGQLFEPQKPFSSVSTLHPLRGRIPPLFFMTWVCTAFVILVIQ